MIARVRTAIVCKNGVCEMSLEERLSELEGKLEVLQAENRALRRQDRGPRLDEGDTAPERQPDVGRRDALKNLGKAAAASVGLVAAGGALAPRAAYAETGGSMIIGSNNYANTGDGTLLQGSRNNLPTFTVTNLDANGYGLRTDGLRSQLSQSGRPAVVARTAGSSRYPQLGLYTESGGEGAPQTSGSVGDVFADAAGVVYVRTANGWRPLYNQQTSPTFFFLPEPIRAVDTRDAGRRPGLPAGTAPLGTGDGTEQEYTIDLSMVNASEDESVGVLANVAVVPEYRGWIAAYPHGSAYPGSASLNYQDDVTSTLLAVGLNDQKFHLRTSGKTVTHVIVDVVGRWFSDDPADVGYRPVYTE